MTGTINKYYLLFIFVKFDLDPGPILQVPPINQQKLCMGNWLIWGMCTGSALRDRKAQEWAPASRSWLDRELRPVSPWNELRQTILQLNHIDHKCHWGGRKDAGIPGKVLPNRGLWDDPPEPSRIGGGRGEVKGVRVGESTTNLWPSDLV